MVRRPTCERHAENVYGGPDADVAQLRAQYTEQVNRAEAAEEALRALRDQVEDQANDYGLWFVARTAPESYLQAALRRLHAAIERVDDEHGTPTPAAAPIPAAPPNDPRTRPRLSTRAVGHPKASF